MKALTFIDYCQYADEQYNSYSDCYDACKEYYKFISQPFRPEMIREMFDGWTIGKGAEEARLSPNENPFYQGVTIIGNKAFYRLIFSDNKKEIKETDIVPITLNDFISNCQRAGIELIFKQEIAKQFENA